MNTNQAACNYALLRFLPYPESGEFVNVGVLVNCIQPCLFRFQMKRTISNRIKALFPEQDAGEYQESMAIFLTELERVKRGIRDPKTCQFAFNELVRPRENTFRFGEVRTVLTTAPQTFDDELFRRYVDMTPAVSPVAGQVD